MADVLSTFEAMISQMSQDELAALDELIAPELSQAWLPNPGPQTDAYLSQADLLLYGGAAGGGKSDLLLGLTQTEQKKSVIFRRAFVDLRGITERLLEMVGSRDGWNGQDKVLKRDGKVLEFGALEKPGAELSWQGRDHDFIGFDEGAQLSASKVAFVLGWLRSTEPGQRCRVVIASNPPMGGEGEWLISWFAPWLDPLFPNPAKDGELRWAYRKGTETVWVDGPGETWVDGEDEPFTHESRTFIPALLEDNPYLKDTGYRARLQNMPEPLRSQLLKGDFLAGRMDHEWQVIPSEWVRAAQDRWNNAPQQRRNMIALACDVALGGADRTAIATLHEGAWFAPIITKPGVECRDPKDVALMMLQAQRNGADLSVDGTGGWGSGVRSNLQTDHSLECASIVFSKRDINAKTKDGKLGYANLRAQMYWQLREALDPDDGDDIMLPPDPRLTAELTAPRYKVRGTDILIEEKEEIKERVGSSPDSADAVVMVWYRRRAISRRVDVSKIDPKRKVVDPISGPGGWLGR